MSFLVKLSSTFFYIGYLPGAPGSIATIAGFFLSVVLSPDPRLYWTVTAVITIVGFIVSEKMEVMSKEKDPSCIVIDEVAGCLIAFYSLPINPVVTVTTFFLFRAFDMFKIYPVNKFEELPGGKGIMIDDLFAGIYTNVTMQIALRLAGLM